MTKSTKNTVTAATITVEQLDALMAKTREVRRALVSRETMHTRLAEASDAFDAAKGALKTAMDHDDFEGIQMYSMAMKKHHKQLADIQDRQQETDDTLELGLLELAGWPEGELTLPAPAPAPEMTEEPLEELTDAPTDELTEEVAA